jgi:hypothetical protein
VVFYMANQGDKKWLNDRMFELSREDVWENVWEIRAHLAVARSLGLDGQNLKERLNLNLGPIERCFENWALGSKAYLSVG